MKGKGTLVRFGRYLRKRFDILFNRSRRYQIGKYTIVLPPEHRVDEYKRENSLIDTVLGELARLSANKYPDLTAIDIGANVGDTAALLSFHRPVPTLCVEGHPRFLEILKRNLRALPPSIEIAECLIGYRREPIPVTYLAQTSGTASLKDHSEGTIGVVRDANMTIKVCSLDQVLHDHPTFLNARLIKIDTDGSDFDILNSSIEYLSKQKPILFFEYAVDLRPDGVKQSIDTMRILRDAGYSIFMVFDNYGNYVGISDDGEVQEYFADLMRYLMSQRLFGQTVIFYYDIIAFAEHDSDVAEELTTCQRKMVEDALKVRGLL